MEGLSLGILVELDARVSRLSKSLRSSIHHQGCIGQSSRFASTQSYLSIRTSILFLGGCAVSNAKLQTFLLSDSNESQSPGRGLCLCSLAFNI